MEYIDKNKSREWAHKLIKEFLKRCLEENGEYPNDLYNAFMRDATCKSVFVERLLEDNNHRCCYCMGNIKGPTIEHMIPQSVKTEETFLKYCKYSSDLDCRNITLTKSFLEKPKDVPPFPHVIAYENLIPSCFGYLPTGASKCCNNFRGDKDIQPLVFRPNIHEEIKYYANGNVIWTKDPEDEKPTIVRLGLDCLELKTIRRIWYYLANHDMAVDSANKNQVIDDLLIKMGVPKDIQENNMQQMLMNFKQTEYWNLLKKYTYFANKAIFE